MSARRGGGGMSARRDAGRITAGPGARGYRAATALLVGDLCLTAIAWAATSALVADPLIRALVGIALLTVAAIAVRPLFGAWRALGVRWHLGRPALLIVPAVIALAPLAWGVHRPSATALGVLLAGYALTGFTEELLWRGMALRALRDARPLVAVLVSSALFGLSHLVNLLYRDSPGLVLAQAWGAFCFGVGYAALRRRIGSIVPLMVLHAITDLVGAVTAGPTIVFFVAQDVVLLTLGLVLVLRER